jgi:hypothetical protein
MITVSAWFPFRHFRFPPPPSTDRSSTLPNVQSPFLCLKMAPSLAMILTVGLISRIALLYKPLMLRIEVLGFNRPLSSIQNIHGSDLHVIPDTAYCEDMHCRESSGLLFAVCEENEENQWKWFPPMTVFDDPTAPGRGSIVVIDPGTFKSNRLSLEKFARAFITHGIDIFTTPDEPTSVYIFAANRLPSPTTRRPVKRVLKSRFSTIPFASGDRARCQWLCACGPGESGSVSGSR